MHGIMQGSKATCDVKLQGSYEREREREITLFPATQG